MPRFVPRQRKHRVIARQNATGPSPPITTSATSSSNQEIIIPQSKTDREEKKRLLREQLHSQQSKVSSKKQKRLDKYIDNKLRKDETLDLLRKLEDQKAKYDASIAAKGESLEKRKFEVFASLGVPEAKRQKPKVEEAEDDASSEDSFEADNPEAFEEEPLPEQVAEKTAPPVIFGSGLAQPLELDENGLPIIQTRKGKKRKTVQESAEEELPWEGFDTEASDGAVDSYSQGSAAFSESESDGSEEDDSQDESSENEDETDDSTSATSSDGNTEKIKPRNSIFKLWATQQINQSMGHTPSYTAGEGQLLPAPLPPPKPETEARLPQPLPVIADNVHNRKAYAVHVERTAAIQEARSQLPILQREQEIMEAIHNNPVVIVKGDTGSGKTTQLPQFLFEAGYGSADGPTPGMIGITQPRRVAAVSMAKRVATELGQEGGKVSYQIRFDSTLSSNTAVKFMTDGILLRELSQDLLLRKYSVIVIDEAHERSVNTDILIGMLSKIVPARMQKSKFNPDPMPLKLVIMSATLNIGDFLHDKLFSPDVRPPIVEAEGRQHRVTTHFALKSRADYVEEVIEKVRRAHRKLPRGGILVFLTGQNEIRQVASRLRALLAPQLSAGDHARSPRVEIASSEAPLEVEDMDLGLINPNEERDDFEMEILTLSDEEAEEKEFDVSDDEEADGQDHGIGVRPNVHSDSKDIYTSVHILPLYSQLPTTEQLKVFDEPPTGSRLIVLATNVAETSLTIPGIRYVFDTGRSKERKYNLDTGVQSFEVDYISKASAAQRAGRAGRTGPGHCWRLYTSAVFESFFPDHAEPEILRAPAESVVLQLKGFAYPRPISDFPFPTPPAPQTLTKAEQLLKNLGGLTEIGEITNIGKDLYLYPLSPRLGKILAMGVSDTNIHLIWHVLTLVSALAVPEIFVTEAQVKITKIGDDALSNEDEEDINNLKQAFGRARATLSKNDKSSDALKLLTAASLYLNTDASSHSELCSSLFLRPKAMSEISQLRSQLEYLVRANNRASITIEAIIASRKTKLPSPKVSTHLNSLVTAGYIDNLCIRYDLAPTPPEVAIKPRRAIDVPYIPLLPLHERASATLHDKAVFIHPSSVLARLSAKDLPAYICYSHLQSSQAHFIPIDQATASQTVPKTRFFPLCPLTAAQIATLARDTALLHYGKPLPKSKIDELPGSPKRRECWVSCEIRAGGISSGVLGWALPPVKVRQVRDSKSREGWRVEEVLG